MDHQREPDTGGLWAERLAFARTTGLRHVTELPQLAGRLDDVALVVVGSTATGWLDAGSDVDIAVVCDEATYHRVNGPEPDRAGDLGEYLVAGVPLHVYAEHYPAIEAQVAAFDDAVIYLYATAVILRDPAGRYARWAQTQFAETSGLRRRRISAARVAAAGASTALARAVEIGDPYVVARIGLDAIGHCLRLAGLRDDIPFDPRKRLFTTALAGPTGGRMAGDFAAMFALLGELGQPAPAARAAGQRFDLLLSSLVASLSEG